MPATGHSAAIHSPARIELAELIGLKPAGESLKLAALRVRAAGAGGHVSAFKGRGIEFDEARPYEPGDDLRAMDWRVTARTGKPHTKVFREERDRPVIVWLDLRRPMHFATHGAFKSVRAAQAAALVAWSAVGNGDRLGGLVFGGHEHVELRPRLGRRAALRLFQTLCHDPFWNTPPGREDGVENAERALLRLTRVARPGSLIFLLSDFRMLGELFERHLRQLARHCEVFLVHFFDTLERELPPPGRYRIHMHEQTLAIDTGGPAVRERYRAAFEQRRMRLEDMARAPSVHLLQCATTEDPRRALAARFETR